MHTESKESMLGFIPTHLEGTICSIKRVARETTIVH
jgi:hypothetical protein